MPYELTSNIYAKHSLLLYLPSEQLNNVRQQELLELLQDGIKLYVLTDRADWLQEEQFDPFRGELLFLHVSGSNLDDDMSLVIDGKMTDKEKTWLKEKASYFSDFNIDQYRVEHFSTDEHLAVMAGAGTGKTTVMMQRILFLLHTTNVVLDDIVLVTFTKEAAQHMFHKLRDVFHTRYKLTGKRLYLQGMEQAGKMRISTISSFAKSLLKELGAVLGFGQDVQIRSFVMERKTMIEHYLNYQWSESLANNRIATKLSGYRMYELVNHLVAFWEEVEKKGHTGEEICKMVWGEADSSSRHFNLLFKEFFHICEQQFQQMKEDENAISLNDLTRQIDQISRRNVSFDNIRRRIRHLFIDEFQDTDETQIRLAIVLQQAFHAKLFVVGDIKQSIYRFRGANETAFQTLNDGLEHVGEHLCRLPLKKNYRTHRDVLEALNPYFKAWGNDEHLVYGDDDRLDGMKVEGESEFLIDRVNFKREDEGLKDRILDHIRKEKDFQTNHTTVLARTNLEAHMLMNWCEEAGIFAHLVVGGGFFITEAVRDFAILIGALLYPQDPAWQLSLRNTPYSHQPIAWNALTPLHGDSRALRAYLDQHPPYPKWNEHVLKLATDPVLSVIREIIETVRPFDVYCQQQIEQLQRTNADLRACESEAVSRSLQYRKNLNHLFDLLQQRFNSDFLTPYTVHKWLEINIATNREEDEPILPKYEGSSGGLEIRTVHKAKGLEFDTVIIPLTDRWFFRPRNEILFRKTNGGIQVGWKLQKRSKSTVYRNYFHNELNDQEQMEIFNEETRLFYVALTRCKKRLVVIYNRSDSKRTWSYLLKLGERGRTQ